MTKRRKECPESGFGNLRQALATRHRTLIDWDGIPHNDHLATALLNMLERYRTLAFNGAPNSGKNFIATVLNGPSELTGARIDAVKDTALIASIVGALNGRTSDGWRLEMSGKRGVKAKMSTLEKRVKLAAAFIDEFDRTNDYHATAAEVAKDNHCSDTTAKKAYSEYRWVVRYILKIDDGCPEEALRVYADLLSSH